eukprot:gene8490-11476_t
MDLTVTRNIPKGLIERKIRPKTKQTTPSYITSNRDLKDAIQALPSNYSFEIYKSIWRIFKDEIKCVALQFPEGLLMYSCIIADILSRFTGVKTILLGDVTYGACCVDDYTAAKLGADLLIHYGHSCLVPVNASKIKVMYVFVEIAFNTDHLVACIEKNFSTKNKLTLMGTIQFNGALSAVHDSLHDRYPNLFVPQIKPLSAGETLGCTSPLIEDADALIFISDGRFHLESAMIQNPHIPAFRYDPFEKLMLRESYDIDRMKQIRWESIQLSRNATRFGLILGTLGHQGSQTIYNNLRSILEQRGKKIYKFLMAEIVPKKLNAIKSIEVWVQVACPRLSIDWSGGFEKPILTPYELKVAFHEEEWKEIYPMDYYGAKS